MREQTNYSYSENHQYKKVKKEGNYTIVEDHRPIEWYKTAFAKAGLAIRAESYTQEYNLKGNNIKDFIIFTITQF